MLGLAPFVVICALIAIASLTAFATWQRRDKRAGDPWSAETAAKIYISTIATFLVAALGLAATPLVAVGVSESPEPAASEATERGNGPSDTGAASTGAPSTPPTADDRADADISGEITLTADHGVDLDTTDRVLLPTDGTPGLDIALSGSPYLYTPDGTSLVRATTRPNRQRCDAVSDSDYYYDFGEGQWFCLTTTDGTTGHLQVTNVTDRSDSAAVAVTYSLYH